MVVKMKTEKRTVIYMTKFLIMFEGKKLGVIEANNYEEALSRVEEVITIEEVDEDE